MSAGSVTRAMLRTNVILYSPQIHWNTGNIGRTCLGMGARLHLVGPLGFDISDKAVRRAGLDYWEHVDLHVHEDWSTFERTTLAHLGRPYVFTKFGATCLTETKFPSEGEVAFIFGNEKSGVEAIENSLRTFTKVKVPMVDDRIRCYNLSTTCGMALWERLRQGSG